MHDRLNRTARLLRSVVAVFTAVATLTLGVVGGLTYLWCAPMGEAHLHCCCPEDEGAADHTSVRRECCESRVVADLPSGAAQDDPDASVAPAALDLTWLASVDATFLLGRRHDTPRPFARAHPGPRQSVHRHCSVYLL